MLAQIQKQQCIHVYIYKDFSIHSNYIWVHCYFQGSPPIFCSPWVLLPEWLSKSQTSLANGTLAQAEPLCISLSWASCPLFLPKHTGLKHSSKIALHLYLVLCLSSCIKWIINIPNSSVCLSMIAALLTHKEQCLLDIQANIQLLPHTYPYKHEASCWKQAGVGGSVPVLLRLRRPHRKSPDRWCMDAALVSLLEQMFYRRGDLCDVPLQKRLIYSSPAATTHC